MTSHVLIISPARSGSTSLRETLNRQPGIMCHGEILGPNRILGISHKISDTELTLTDRMLDRQKFITTLLDRPEFGRTGFKALYEHFFISANAYYLNWILARRPKVIFLWRRNLVSRFKSECILRHEAGMLPLDKLQRIKPDNITADAQVQMEMAGWILQILQMHNKGQEENVLKIDFEDLVSDPGVTAQILQFLDVDADAVKLGKDRRTSENAGRSETPVLPEAFEKMASTHLADVSLEAACARYAG